MSYIYLSDADQDFMNQLMTSAEYARMQAYEASGMSHEAAKAKVYAERTTGVPAAVPVAVAVPTPEPAPTLLGRAWSRVKQASWGEVALAGAGLGLAAGIASAIFKAERRKPEFDAASAPTGIFSRPPRA